MKWFLLITGLFFSLFSPDLSCAKNTIADHTYERLDSVRQQKKLQILQLFDHVQNKAEFLKNDEVMHKFFFFMDALKEQGRLSNKSENSKELEQVINEYCRTVDQYYLQNYLDFYDILLVDKKGEIFYTVRKEDDFQKNIFTSKLADTRLAKQLMGNPNVFFVDYHYYFPADEPAAFFVVPVIRNGNHEGWILLQYAINKLNTLMVDYQELGDTGEIYLVNQDHMILTNSRFKAEEASLRLKVDTEAVNSAFLEGEGHRLITGYRGVRVFTSYEKFSLWGTDWALVASIEEDEIITDYYLQNSGELAAPLFNYLANRPMQKFSGLPPEGKLSKVDIDEFKKAGNGSVLHTRGVSTCTAIAVLYPGHFAYLAHISPFDKIYGQVNLTNQLKDLVGRIKYYDIYLRELGNLRVLVVANHPNSFRTVIDKLTRYGIRLSQIFFAYNPDSKYANVTCAGNGKDTLIEWVADNEISSSFMQKTDSIESLSRAVMQVSGYSRGLE